jgi:copper chaperone CopZ
MKKIVLIMWAFWGMTAAAQVKKVSLQASGLTCSMCSNAIFKSLKTLDFVSDVDANIKTSTFDISFKTGAAVNFDQLKKKVEDAGFFVANFTATVQFDKQVLNSDEHVNVHGMLLHFLDAKGQTIEGEQKLKLLDKGYVSTKTWKQNNKLTKMECYKTGVAAACCSKEVATEGKRVFHVSI